MMIPMIAITTSSSVRVNPGLLSTSARVHLALVSSRLAFHELPPRSYVGFVSLGGGLTHSSPTLCAG